ncbi:hypothetical protein EDWATA_03543 [Edwardsiella tarda ATCC 23685]|uniref:Uncharacterized protein n=1 Tax=Edwardsiella tarda ATCC 23685 TaxID=500638 RepID=D4F9T1_EDWTA|nr:hypothetical protein EDWATA_03543 [Edwardsiella tarda ATCC 23685]
MSKFTVNCSLSDHHNNARGDIPVTTPVTQHPRRSTSSPRRDHATELNIIGTLSV